MDSFLDERLRVRLFGEGGRVALRVTRMRAGLEAAAVHLVVARGRDRRGQSVEHRYVHKVAHGPVAREAGIYRRLVHRYLPTLAPRLLHVERPRKTVAILYLEHVPGRPWPWSELDISAAVLERIASLHELEPDTPLPAWDYESELAGMARWTVDMARRATTSPARDLVRGAVPMLEDLTDRLPVMRAYLASERPFAGRVIHGDLHPGNVMIRRLDGHADPVLIDWARTRVGSALEDLSSWAQSLATWEPEMRRRHDSLLQRYLVARGLSPRLSTELRDLYWFAAASNALAGALGVHLEALADQRELDPHGPSARSARDWLRIARQARARL